MSPVMWDADRRISGHLNRPKNLKKRAAIRVVGAVNDVRLKTAI